MTSSSSSGSGWDLYHFPPSVILGFHGCDASVGEAILSGKVSHLLPSNEDYHWLGKGIYFWKSNPQRALEWAGERAAGRHGKRYAIHQPFVVGAILNMGRCLNLCDSSALYEVEDAYKDFSFTLAEDNLPLPENGKSKKMRRLDCAVFEFLHDNRRETGILPPYQTVRGTYHEGNPIFPGTDLSHQDHTQICVRDVTCILGYFRPINLS